MDCGLVDWWTVDWWTGVRWTGGLVDGGLVTPGQRADYQALNKEANLVLFLSRGWTDVGQLDQLVFTSVILLLLQLE